MTKIGIFIICTKQMCPVKVMASAVCRGALRTSRNIHQSWTASQTVKSQSVGATTAETGSRSERRRRRRSPRIGAGAGKTPASVKHIRETLIFQRRVGERVSPTTE